MIRLFETVTSTDIWTRVQSRPLSADASVITFDVDFAVNPIYKIIGTLAGAGSVQPALRVNQDAGVNYGTRVVSMVDSGTPYNHSEVLSRAQAVVGSGWFGDEFSTSEQSEECIYLLKIPAGLFIVAETHTNGSGAGDVHFLLTKWTGAAPITRIDIHSNIVTPTTGNFAAGSRLDLLTMKPAA